MLIQQISGLQVISKHLNKSNFFLTLSEQFLLLQVVLVAYCLRPDEGGKPVASCGLQFCRQAIATNGSSWSGVQMQTQMVTACSRRQLTRIIHRIILDWFIISC
jgi:hypothetical protein